MGLSKLTRVQAGQVYRAVAPTGIEPSAEAVVYALYGPLHNSRASLVHAAFDAFDSSKEGRVAVNELRRRCAILEHPAVKIGRWSAEEASQSLFHAWRRSDRISAEEFMASHIPLSALVPGDAEAFAHMLRALWQVSVDRLAVNCSADSRSSERPRRAFAEPRTGFNGEEVRPQEKKAAKSSAGRKGAVPEFVPPRACDEQSSRRLAMEKELHRSRHAKQLLERLRTALRRRGSTDTIARLARSFNVAGGRGDNRIDATELEAALNRIGIGMSSEDVQDLLHAMDRNGDGSIDFEEWLHFVRGPLTPQRAAVVREAFDDLDADGDGLVDISDLGRRFASWTHPDVASGRRSRKEVHVELLDALSAAARGGRRVHMDDFMRYYETISASIESDQYFFHLVRSAWGLDHSDPYTQFARNARHAYDGHIVITEGGLSG